MITFEVRNIEMVKKGFFLGLLYIYIYIYIYIHLHSGWIGYLNH